MPRSSVLQDLSQSVVLEGTHYVAIGEHADFWIGEMSDLVAVKVLRGGSSSNPEFLREVAVKVLRGGSSSNPDFLHEVAVKVLRGGSSINPKFPQKFKERLEHGAHVFYLNHPKISEYFGLAFTFGYMPALILPFCGNVIDYAKMKADEARLGFFP